MDDAWYSFSEKFYKIYRETPALVFLFSTAAAL